MVIPNVLPLLKNKTNWIFILLGVIVLGSIVGLGFQLFGKDPTKMNESPTGKSTTDRQSNPTVTPSGTTATPANYFNVDFLKVPEGFGINVFARDLGKVRSLKFDINGALYATVQDQGKVIVVRDDNQDGVSDITKTLLSGLNKPHGLEIVCPDNLPTCYMFVAETGRITRYNLDINRYELSEPFILTESIPEDGLHVTRSILARNFDGKNTLLISIGSSCNVCNEEDDSRAKIMKLDINSATMTQFASGLRNSVFMTYDPKNGNIYATDMGRDWLGDNVPPDEINLIEEGKFYGWPYCYGNNVQDSTFNAGQEGDDACNRAEAPKVQIQAHSAPLGIRFMPNSNPWGEEYSRNVFVAYHGSWNREEPTGYKIVSYKIDDNGNFSEPKDFITGFIDENDQVNGRPVDIVFSDSGVMFISDDKEGRIYRVIKK